MVLKRLLPDGRSNSEFAEGSTPDGNDQSVFEIKTTGWFSERAYLVPMSNPDSGKRGL
jgi:hypothetical protein